MFIIFSIDSETGVITSQSALDYEQNNVAVHETVLDNCRWYGLPSAGFLVTRCIDTDTPSSQITYSLVSTGSINPLILDEASGSFSVNADLDYESQTSYSSPVTITQKEIQMLVLMEI